MERRRDRLLCCFRRWFAIRLLLAAGLLLEEVDRLCVEVASLRGDMEWSSGREEKLQALVQVMWIVLCLVLALFCVRIMSFSLLLGP